ncbi:hypothetical protein TNCV_142901 [Trichonephila clavipes]|nr:hypothetical protein TNCV_142901 [Trichonephila clavipes]
MPTLPNSVYVTLVPEVHEQMFRSGGQSDATPPVLSSQASLASRRAVLLDRWIVRSVPLEIVESSGHEKAPTRGKPGLERPGRPRGERIEGSCAKHFWSPQ